jgi:hypothetical protein
MPGLYRRPPQPQRRRPTIPVEGPLGITCDLIDGGAVVSALVDVPQHLNLSWYHPVTVESVGTGAYTASASTLDVPIPAGAVAGDFLYLYMAWDSPSDAITVGSVPSGWSSQNGNTGYGLGTHIYWRYHNGTDTQATVGTSGTTKIRGVIIAFDNGVPEDPPTYGSWAPGGWTGGNVAEVLAFPAAFSTYKETNPTCLIVIDGNDAITNPEGTQTTLFDSGSGTTMRMVVFRGPVFRQPYTVYSDIPGFWVSYGTVQDIKYQRVYINNKAATQKEMFYPALIDGGASIYALSEIKHYHHVQPALIDGGATVYSLASVYPDQFVSPDLIDGVSAIYGSSVVRAPYPITVGLIDSGAAIYGTTVVKAPYPVTVGLIDSGAAIYDTTVVHQALPIVEGTSSGVDASSTTTHVFNLPSGVQAGDLIFFIATANASTGGITPPVDWLPNTDDTDPSYLGYGGGIIALSYYKIAAGGETTVSFSTVNSMRYHYIAYRISGAWDGYPGDPVSPMELWAGTSYPYATGTSVDPDPPSVSWPADRDTVWIAVALSLSANVATAAPSGYSGLVTTPALTNADTISTAHRVVRRSTSEDPGVFTLVYGYWNAYTIGVRGKYFGAQGLALMRIPDGPSSVIYGLTLTKYNTVAPALIDGVSAIYDLSVVKAPYPITVGLIDAGPAIYSLTVAGVNGLTLGLIDAIPAGGAAIVLEDSFVEGSNVALTSHTPITGGPWYEWDPNGDCSALVDAAEDAATFSSTRTQGQSSVSAYAGAVGDGYVEVNTPHPYTGISICRVKDGDPSTFYASSSSTIWRVTAGVWVALTSHGSSGFWWNRFGFSGSNPTSLGWMESQTEGGLSSSWASSISDNTAGNQMSAGGVGIWAEPGEWWDEELNDYEGGWAPVQPVLFYGLKARDDNGASSERIWAPTLANKYPITLGLVGADAAIYDLIVESSSATVEPALIDGEAAIYALGIVQTQVITVELIDGGAAIYDSTVVKAPYPITLSLIDPLRVLVVDDTFSDAGTGVADLSTHTPELGGPWVRAFGGGNYPNAGFIDIDKDNDWAEPSGTITQGAWDYGSSVYRAGQISDGFVEGRLDVGSNGGRSGLVIRQSGASYYDNFYVFFGGSLYRMTGGVISYIGNHIYSGPWYRLEVSGTSPTQITLRSASTREGLDSASGTVYSGSTAGNQMASGYVGVYGTTEDQNGMVYSGPIDGFRAYSREAIFPLTVQPDQFVSPALIDGGAAIYDATVVPAPLSVTLALIDGAADIYSLSLRYTQTITADLIDGGAVVYGLLIESNTIVTALIDGGAAIYALEVQPDQFVTVGLIDSGAAIYTISVVRAPWPITVALIDASGAIYSASVVKAPYPITVALIDGAAAIYALTVIPDQLVSPNLIDGEATVYASSVVKAPWPVTVGLIDAAGGIYAILVTYRNYITVDLIDGAAAIYDATVVAGSATITTALIDGGATPFAIIAEGGSLIVTDLIDGAATVYDLSVIPQPVTVTLDLVGADGEAYALSAKAVNSLTIDLIDGTAEIYSVAITRNITLALIDSVSALYPPTLQFNMLLELIDGGAWIWPLVAYAEGVVEGSSEVSFGWSTTGAGSAPVLGPAESTFTWRSDGWGAYAAIFGTGASGWGWAAYGGAGSEEMRGSGAPAFDWDTSSAAYVLHPSDSSFTFATAGEGSIPILGPSDVSFVWLPFAAGQVGITGTSASSFAKFTTSGTGAAGAVGTGASSYNWTTGASEGAVAEEVTGTGASDFNWTNGGGVGWHVEDDSVIGYSDVAFNWEAVSTTQIVPGTGFVSGGAGDTTWVTITS